jgi:hypothetical protein
MMNFPVFRSRFARCMLGAAGVVLTSVGFGCGEESAVAPPPPPPPPAPAFGWIIVVANVSGGDTDADGFDVTVYGEPPRTLAGGSALVLSDVAPGKYIVRLDGIASNCVLRDENPRTVFVAERQAAVVLFNLICLPHTVGAIRVAVLTLGFAFGASLDGGPVVQATNGEVVFDHLLPGLHTVQLHIAAGECLLEQPGIQSHNVVAGRVTQVLYSLSCPVPIGSLIVDVATTGTNHPAGYTVRMTRTDDPYCYDSWCSSRTVAPNGQVRFDRMGVGDYYVNVHTFARNCTPAPGTHTVRIERDTTIRVAFVVSCV